MAEHYTHYYRVIANDEGTYRAWREDACKILNAHPGELVNVAGYWLVEHMETEPWVRHTLLINGRNDVRGDFFIFPRSELVTDTHRYPYDTVVCTLLLAAKHHYGENLHIVSDGLCKAYSGVGDVVSDNKSPSVFSWWDAFELYERVFPDRGNPLKERTLEDRAKKAAEDEYDSHIDLLNIKGGDVIEVLSLLSRNRPDLQEDNTYSFIRDMDLPTDTERWLTIEIDKRVKRRHRENELAR